MNDFGKAKIWLVVAIVAPIAAIGLAGAVASFYNFTDFLNGHAASALGLVAAGEGATLVCALVMLLLTVLGRPTPGVVRAGLWLLPVVASAVGATLAPDLNMKVTAAITPLAMTVAGEGVALVMRNVVAYRTGVDLEANRRAGLMVWHVRRANNGSGLGKRASKAAVWRLARQFAANDAQMSVQLSQVQRYRISEGADAGMAAVLSGGAAKTPELPSAGPSQPAAPELPPLPVRPRTAQPAVPELAPVLNDDYLKGVLDDAESAVAFDPGVSLLTVADVARIKGVKPGSVRSWIHRGKLRVAARDDDGRALFTELDVSKLD